MSWVGYTWWSLRGSGDYQVVFFKHWGFGYWRGWRWFEWRPRRVAWPSSSVWHWLWFDVHHCWGRGFHTAGPMRRLYEERARNKSD